MCDKQFYTFLATTLCGIAIGTTVIYRKIDKLRIGICRKKYWYYVGADKKTHYDIE